MYTNATAVSPLRATDIMSHAPICAHAEDDLFEIVATMVHEAIRHVVILGAGESVVGILSDRDVRAIVGDPARALALMDEQRHQYVSVETVMAPNPITVTEDTLVTDIARHLIEERIGALPVIGSGERLVGLVSYVDVLYHVWHGTLICPMLQSPTTVAG